MRADPSLLWRQAWGQAGREAFEASRTPASDKTSPTASISQQLSTLQQLRDDGLITDEEYEQRRSTSIDEAVTAPTPPPTLPTTQPAPSPPRPPSAASTQLGSYEGKPKAEEKPIWQRPPVIVTAAVIALLLVGYLSNNRDNGATRTQPASTVTTRDATSDVQNTLLGPAWIGSGAYTLHAAAKAYDASEDFTAYAARISAPGADDLCLYWYVGGRNFGDGLTIGDTVTREFSDWGSLASADSPAADMVRSSASTPEGRAVIAKVGC